MTNSWDWVEKHNKRERQRKRFRIFGIIMMLFFLLFVIGIPPLFKPNDDPPAPQRGKQEIEPVVETQEQQIRQPETDRVATTKIKTENRSPENRNRAPATQTKADLPPLEIAPPPIANSIQVPKEPQPDPAQQRAAERAISKLDRAISHANGNGDRLNSYGGEKWKEIQALARTARESDNPSETIELAEEASSRIAALLPKLQYAEFNDQIRGKDSRDVLASIVKFRSSHSDHPRLTDMAKDIAAISREQWLQMAASELEAAAPDDSGFAEGWLPIASAWQLVGNDAEAREALRHAVAALPRMTLPERVIESTIDICQHESFDKAASAQLIESAAEMCKQIASKWIRGSYFANLSGLASKLGHRTLASRLLERALSPDNMNVEFGVTEKLILTQQARAASWTAKPEAIFSMCSKLEKLNYPKPVYNANAYGHAAIAAARHNDNPQFFRAMLLTENALAPLRVHDYPNYLYAVRLAEANLLHRRWRAAVIVANNIPDPYVRASLLFRIMKDAPQEIRTPQLANLFKRFADQRYASPACAGHAEHRIRSGDDLVSVAEWALSLPLASQRAAAFAGIARSIGTTTVTTELNSDQLDNGPAEIDDVVSLMDAAERTAHQIQEPLDAAFVWMQIARTWNLLGKTQRYRQALSNIDDRLFDVWATVWEDRPPVKRSYNGGYIDADDRHRDDEKYAVGMIVACHRLLAEMQVNLGDSRGAMESCLNLANAAGFLDATATYNNWNFLHLKALLNRLDGATKVGPDAVLLTKHRSYRYTRALMAAWAKDIPGLEAALPELVEHYQSRKANSNERHIPARAYGELAILYAERGNTEAYRNARRSAQSQVTQGRAGSEMKLILATADALAGEYALAESNLVRGTLGWFGDANLPRKQLAISLAEDGQWEKALEHARRVSKNQPLYRAQAWAAVAEGRRKSGSETAEEILEWSASIESQVDRAAAYCGLSLAVTAR